MLQWIKKRRVLLIMAAILIICGGIRIHYGMEKSYLHIDEAYSFGLMNYDHLNIADNPDFENRWHDSDYYLDYLSIGEENVEDFTPVYENQKNDVHPPFYYLLLRAFSSITPDSFHMWSGLILNLLCFCGATVLIYFLGKRLTKSDTLALVLCAVNGLSMISLSSFCYIRMYELANLLVLWVTYLCVVIYQENLVESEAKKTRNGWSFPLLTVALVLCGLTHYFAALFAGCMVVFLGILLFMRKRRAESFFLLLTTAIAVTVCLQIFPYALDHIFFSYRGIGAEDQWRLYTRISTFLYLISEHVFAGFLPVIAVAMVIGCGMISAGKKEHSWKMPCQLLLFIPLLLFYVVAILKSPYLETRYIMPVYSVTILFVLCPLFSLGSTLLKSRGRYVALSALCVLLCMRTTTGMEIPEFVYEDYQYIVQEVKESKAPLIRMIDRSNNRFLDDIYLFAQADTSIVADKAQVKKCVEELVQARKSFYVILPARENIGQYDLNGGQVRIMKKLNAGFVYKINFKTGVAGDSDTGSRG